MVNWSNRDPKEAQTNKVRPAILRFAYLVEPPFCYRTPDGKVAGCDVELARHVSAAIGIGSFLPIEAEFAELLPGADADRWDMTTGLFVTDERRRLALFNRPIWALPDGLLVPADLSDRIGGYRTIAADTALKLAVVAGQVQHNTARHLA